MILIDRALFQNSNCYPLFAPLPPRLDSVCFFKEAKRSSESFKKRLILDSKFSVDSRKFLCRAGLRSEEHTSELQSRGHLVCRLLLEKKTLYLNIPLVNQI